MGGNFEIGRRVDNDRALPSKFEGDRREVLHCSSHHDPPDGSVAGIEDVIETLFE